jgi:hypothetical protein
VDADVVTTGAGVGLGADVETTGLGVGDVETVGTWLIGWSCAVG